MNSYFKCLEILFKVVDNPTKNQWARILQHNRGMTLNYNDEISLRFLHNRVMSGLFCVLLVIIFLGLEAFGRS